MARRVEPVAPIGRNEAGLGFVSHSDGGCGVEPVFSNIYPDNGGDGLRKTRIACRFSLREAAALLEMTPVDLAGLERGQSKPIGITCTELADILNKCAGRGGDPR